jgi:putative spermidine/putrescine transport system permease protein
MAPPRSKFERIVNMTTKVVAGLVLFYLVAPIVAIIPLSFTDGSLLVYPLPGLSTRWYQDFFTNPHWTRAIWNSVVIAVPTTLLATFLGTLAAFGFHLSNWPIRKAIAGLLILPLVVPIVIVAVATFYYFAALELIGTYKGIIVAHTVLAIPFVLITVSATLNGFDLVLVRAAQGLGAAPFAAFRYIVVPIIWPGVVAGALFAFVTSFDEIVVVLFIAGPEQRTLPREIFSGVSESISPTIVVAAIVIVTVSVLLMIVVELLRRRAARYLSSSEAA